MIRHFKKCAMCNKRKVAKEHHKYCSKCWKIVNKMNMRSNND